MKRPPVFIAALLALASALFAAEPGAIPPHQSKTVVSIQDDMFLINGKPTYAGRTWNGCKIEGLLMNSRMVQGVFDDLNPASANQWRYPDTGKWDPERNTNEFIAAMPEWRANGLLAFTLGLQGGGPLHDVKNQQMENSAFDASGELRQGYMDRLERILNKADDLGMVVILGFFYFGQDQRLADDAAVINAVDHAVAWIGARGYRNVLVEIGNEIDMGLYDRTILKSRVHELIVRVKRARPFQDPNVRLLASTSFRGGAVPSPNVVKSADFLLIHGNGVKESRLIAEQVKKCRLVAGYRPMPILFNEDNHFDFEKPDSYLAAAVREYAGWGYYDQGENNYVDGYQSVPVNWGINTKRKKAFFEKVKEITLGAPQ
jgi:hypothetical protein